MAPDPLIGRTLAKCRIERRLGEGGMGRVYVAHHEALDKKVAVKVLSGPLATDPQFITRFLREARSAARLEHQNAVQVLDAGSEGDLHYIVMQYVEGTDLASILKKRGRLPVKDALSVGRRVASALDTAHARGIIHRDIKPANILLRKDGKVLVADFGLARDAAAGASITGTDTVLGTPWYMSPEQAEGKSVDARSDLYSLGATLYHLIAGRPPFEGTSGVSILMKHVDPDLKPPPLRAANPEVPAEVETLIHKLLAKQPAARPASAKEVVQEIDRITRGAPDATAPRRRWLPVAMAGGVVALLAVVAAVVLLATPSKTERAFRDAERLESKAGDDLAALARAKARYEDAVRLAPDSDWGRRAKARLAPLGDRIATIEIDAEIARAKADLAAGTQDFPTTLVRLQLLEREHAGSALAGRIAAEIEGLHRNRLVQRAQEVFDALVRRAWDEILARVDPSKMRQAGELRVRAIIGGFILVLHLQGKRVDAVVPDRNGIVLDLAAGTASVPVATTLTHVREGRTEEKTLNSDWVLSANDWFWIPPEKALR